MVPKGLQTFLSNLSDKAKLLAVPLNSCPVSITAAICSGGAAPMSLAAVYASVSLGKVMVKMYETSKHEEIEKEKVGENYCYKNHTECFI